MVETRVRFSSSAHTKPDGLVWAAIGDSITQASAYPQGWNGYAQQLISSLREDYGRNKDVFMNLAVLGDTTTEEVYYAKQRIGRYQPYVIMIALGINDLMAQKTNSLHTGADVHTIINNYKLIIKLVVFKTRKCQSLLAQSYRQNTQRSVQLSRKPMSA